MLFKSIKQLKNQLGFASSERYKQENFLQLDKGDLLQAATEIDNAKIFNMGEVKQAFAKLREIGANPESKAVLESIVSLEALPFDNILFTFKINQKSQNNVIGAKNYIPQLPHTYIIAINKLNEADLLVYVYMDKFEVSKRMMQADQIDPTSDVVIPKLELTLQGVYRLNGGGINAIDDSIDTLLYLDEPLMDKKQRKDFAKFHLTAATAFVNLVLYYNVAPAIERTVKRAKKGANAKESVSSNYVIDFTKPRVKYSDLPEKPKGTHKSPVEHSRAGHYRRYKSGKVVKIGSTTVNKGNVSNSDIDKQYKL